MELCRLLVALDHPSPEGAKSFLRPSLDQLPDPGALAGAQAAAGRILRAIDAGETVLVHGDYDVDGVCAATLLTSWIRRLGGTAHPFAPHRTRHGYDLGPGGLDRAREVGAGLLVTVDCGILAHDAVAEARAGGLEVVVTDHHTPGPTLPAAVAVVNPNRTDDDSGQGYLCGAGVAFQICRLLARARGVPDDAVLSDLDLVALATVADLVPLVEGNRAMVRFGLKVMAGTKRPGLRALIEVCGARGEIDAGTVGFTLAPRINAVGRVGDAQDAISLLMAPDLATARPLAQAAEALNRERREEDQRTLDEALEQLADQYDPERDWGVVLAGEGWHPGVIGIVASRVVERIHRPAVLVALDGERGRGSARSVRGFHLYEALERCGHLLDRFGGHAQAAGMDVARSRLQDFREAFNTVARETLDAEALQPTLRATLEVDPAALDLQTAEYARYLGPHGIGNPRPLLLARDLELRGAPRVVGTNHLKLELGRGGHYLSAIGFGLADRIPPASLNGSRVDAIFQLTVNEFRGTRAPQLRLRDVRPAGGPVAPVAGS